MHTKQNRATDSRPYGCRSNYRKQKRGVVDAEPLAWWSICNQRRTHGRAQKLYVCTDCIPELGAEPLAWWSICNQRRTHGRA
ncbi:MAG: hypothetical protein MJ080_02485 [Clostridia bacterium]|nr:hypothetical protein [Clostridia bacterium]